MAERAKAIGRNRRRGRESRASVSVADHFLVVLLFWALTLHIFDLWCVVLLHGPELRRAVGDPLIFGFSHHQASIALAALLFVYALVLVVDRRHLASRWARIWRPLVYALFVALFGLRLGVHARFTLNDEWHSMGERLGSWNVRAVHLGLVTELDDEGLSRVRIAPERAVQLPLPVTGFRSCIVAVREMNSYFTDEVAYMADSFVRYDDLATFLARHTEGLGGSEGALRAPVTCALP